MRGLLIASALLAACALAWGDVSNTIPPVKDVGNEESIRRDVRRATENVLPRAGGDMLTFRDVKNQRVGIGTDSPVCTLDVDGDFCAGDISADSITVTTITGTSLTVTSITATTATITDLAVTSVTVSGGEIFSAVLNYYRLPELVVASTNAVFIENNTGTANQTTIIFPDGDVRSVTESTSTADQYRMARSSSTASLSTTHDSGMRSGETVAANTAYAVYAVKTSDNASNFILVLTTGLPIQANKAALDGYFGATRYRYVGMVWYGDGASSTTGFISMRSSGGCTYFTNTAAGSAMTGVGKRLATSAGTTSLTYTRANGTAAAQIPDHLEIGTYLAGSGTSASISITDAANLKAYFKTGVSTLVSTPVTMALDDGMGIQSTSSVAKDIYLMGYCDPLLSMPGIGF